MTTKLGQGFMGNLKEERRKNMNWVRRITFIGRNGGFESV